MRYLLAAAAALLALPATAIADTIPVPPGGNLTTAYNNAQAGDTIELSTGKYGSWDTPAGDKQITIRAAQGARPVFKRLHVHANNVTLDGVHVDAEGTRTAPGSPFETHGGHDITFKNGSIGNNIDQMAALAGGSDDPGSLNIVFDNVDFHDAVMTPQGEAGGVHMECLYSQAPGLVVKNSRFRNCSVMDLFITRGDWWGQPRYDGITLLNNEFDTPRRVNGACCHFYSVGVNGLVSDGNFEQFVARGNKTTINGSNGSWSAGTITFNGSVESCNTPPSGFRGITVEPCGAEPTPTPTPTPSPSPSPTPVPTPEPDPDPVYAPECAPDCDEQIAQLEGQLATALNQRDQAVENLATMTSRYQNADSWRDRWKTRALEAEAAVANLPRIRELVNELDAALTE